MQQSPVASWVKWMLWHSVHVTNVATDEACNDGLTHEAFMQANGTPCERCEIQLLQTACFAHTPTGP